MFKLSCFFLFFFSFNFQLCLPGPKPTKCFIWALKFQIKYRVPVELLNYQVLFPFSKFLSWGHFCVIYFRHLEHAWTHECIWSHSIASQVSLSGFTQTCRLKNARVMMLEWTPPCEQTRFNWHLIRTCLCLTLMLLADYVKWRKSADFLASIFLNRDRQTGGHHVSLFPNDGHMISYCARSHWLDAEK